MKTTASKLEMTSLSPLRINLLRGAYLLVGLGLAIVKWPLLADAHTFPLYEGVVLCMLTAMSLLALVGVWLPERLIPILLFEIGWKLLWLGLVALPQSVDDTMDTETMAVMYNCLIVIVVIAAVPWRQISAGLVPRSG